MESIKLSYKGANAQIDLFGGMTMASFSVNGRAVSPLYKNAWGALPGLDAFSAHLKGDFFCLPFGIAPREKLSGEWRFVGAIGEKTLYPHGYSANGIYRIKSVCQNRAVVTLTYDDGKIDRVERAVTLGDKALSFCDTVFARRAFSAPVGLHPIFALPRRAGGAALSIPANAGLFTYPAAVDQSAVFAEAACAGDLKKIPLKHGGNADITRLPLAAETEELLFIAGVTEGKCRLVNEDEKYAVTLRWDEKLLSNCLLWLSNKGRKYFPWNGENLCLGIEPVASAFDLGEKISLSDNPLAEKGFSTSCFFTPDKPVKFEHSIGVEAL